MIEQIKEPGNFHRKGLGRQLFDSAKEIWGEENPCQIYIMSLK